MAFCVAKHQGELRNQVLQIVDYKGRHAIEGLELACFEQSISGLQLCKVARRLLARGLEQIAHFPIHIERSSGAREYGESQQFVVGGERNNEPGFRDLREPSRWFEASIPFRIGR